MNITLVEVTDYSKIDAAAEALALALYDAYEGTKDTGVMVAFMLPESVASQLAVEGGNKPDQLHVTLAYLGKLSEVESQLDAVRQVLSSMTVEDTMLGKINGLGRFGASETSDNKEVIYATLDMPGLTEWRTQLVDDLEAAGVEVATDHDFAPHITLSYVEPGEEFDVPMPDYQVTMESVSLVFGDTREDFQLRERNGRAGLDFAFDPEKHPHRPSGDEHGGEFAPKGTKGVEDIARAEALADTIMKKEGVDKKFEKIRDAIKAGEDTKTKFTKNGVYTEKRQELHNKIITGIYGDTEPVKNPEFIMTGGLPASGKSSMLERKVLFNYVKLDGDSVKMQLPEYKGWNASHVEKEAEDIINEAFKYSTRTKRNIIFDGTMKSMDQYIPLATAMKKRGYTIAALYMDVPMKLAIKKSIRRYHRMGRFVDPLYIASNDAHNKKTFEALKPIVDRYEHYDKKKRLIDASH